MDEITLSFDRSILPCCMSMAMTTKLALQRALVCFACLLALPVSMSGDRSVRGDAAGAAAAASGAGPRVGVAGEREAVHEAVGELVGEGWRWVRVPGAHWQLRRRRGGGLSAGQALRRLLVLRRLVVVEGEALVGGVAEAGGDDHDGPGGDQRAGDRAADDLALPAGEVDGEAGGGRGSRRREEGAAEREDLEAAGEVDGGAGPGPGLPDGDVGDVAGAAEDADADLAPAREPGDAVDDVAPRGDLEDVGAQRAGAVPRDDHRRLGLVLGPRRAAPGAPHHHGLRRLLLARRSRQLLVVVLVRAAVAAAAVAPGAVDGVAVVGELLLRRRATRSHELLLEMLERRVLPREVVRERVERRRRREVVPAAVRRSSRHGIHLSRAAGLLQSPPHDLLAAAEQVFRRPVRRETVARAVKGEACGRPGGVVVWCSRCLGLGPTTMRGGLRQARRLGAGRWDPRGVCVGPTGGSGESSLSVRS
uniref:Uncharacterized protein n=1 Tax=Setaria italica TaxID=4555 RepID=K3XWN2_SETIT